MNRNSLLSIESFTLEMNAEGVLKLNDGVLLYLVDNANGLMIAKPLNI